MEWVNPRYAELAEQFHSTEPAELVLNPGGSRESDGLPTLPGRGFILQPVDQPK